MPLPWKKKKSGGGGGTSGRISRFMDDLQSPSKRGGSLVVETGFPTFLIDLFVKNRDRMDKSSKRSKREKQKPQQQVPQIEIEEKPTVSLVDNWEILTRTASVAEEVYCASPSRSHTFAEEPDEKERGLDGTGSESVDPSDDLLDQSPDRFSSLFLAMPMVAILGFLAMFTKWLVMGAMITAFLLGFAEFLGAPVGESLKPCIHGEASFRGLIRNAETSQKSKPKVNRDSPSNPDPIMSVSTGLKPVTGAIEVSFSSKSQLSTEARVEDGMNPNADVDLLSGEDVGHQEQAGRRSKLRSKILKKIVPKKIRHQKKGGDGPGLEFRSKGK